MLCAEGGLSLKDLICSLCLCVLPVCVYVNKHGNCGPHLDRKQMQHLPDHFGPGPVNAVLQQVVQSCIDCAYQPKVLLSALQTHSGGGEIVRGRHTDTIPVIISCCYWKYLTSGIIITIVIGRLNT